MFTYYHNYINWVLSSCVMTIILSKMVVGVFPVFNQLVFSIYFSSCNTKMFSSVSAASLSLQLFVSVPLVYFDSFFRKSYVYVYANAICLLDWTAALIVPSSVANISCKDIYFGSDRNSLRLSLIFPITIILIIIFWIFNMFYRSDSPQVKLYFSSCMPVL